MEWGGWEMGVDVEVEAEAEVDGWVGLGGAGRRATHSIHSPLESSIV